MAERASRRAVLVTAAALPVLAAGCKGLGILGPPPAPGPEVIMLDRAIRAEELLVATYRAALAALPGRARPAAAAAAVLAEHKAHLRQLRFRLILPPRLAAARPGRSPSPPPLPDGRAALLGALATAEREAAARLLRELLGAPPGLAQLMASIAASEAAHAVVLSAAGRR